MSNDWLCGEDRAWLTYERLEADISSITWEDSLPEPYSMYQIPRTTAPWGQLDCFCAGGGLIMLGGNNGD